MKNYLSLIVIAMLLSVNIIYPQMNVNRTERGKVLGKVFDYDSNHSIEYANIVLLSPMDSSLVNGTVTDVNGDFVVQDLKFGKYLLEIRFIGYQTKSTDIEINTDNKIIDVGDIYIQPEVLELNDVVVQGHRSPVSYQIDKKVIDVDKIQTVISGNAADVLQNVPSVTVDIEGNVSLRGSSNFTVLIDGRPSIMSAQDALQQIPASSISNIEIITNPSAKYDPEGTAGIINIIQKKNQNLGFSGIINANAGLNENFGGDFLFQYRTSDLIYTFSMDYNKRDFPGSSNVQNIYYSNNSTSYLNSSGTAKWGRIGFGLKAGVEFNLTENDFIGIVARFGTREGNQNSTSYFSNWTNLEPNILSYQSLSDRMRDGEYGGTNLTYIKKFNGKGHELKGEFNFRYNEGDESTLTESIQNAVLLDGKKTTEFGPSRDFETKIDYTLPFSDINRFEAGYENEIEFSDEINELFELDSLTRVYEYRSLFSNSTRYKDNNHALYATYSDQFGDFGIQGGFRTEYTNRTITLLKSNNEFKIDRWDYFPTLHTSFKFSEGTQLMASYSRRIQRPRGWELEPFYTWTDANNIRIGNPALLPEFIDSYETGIQTYVGKFSFSAELYHRMTKNKIDRLQSVYPDAVNVNLNTVDNIGKDYSTGSEFMVIFDPVAFWNVNFMANLYNYRIEGSLFNKPFLRESFNWNTRVNNMLKISSNTQLQINFNYNSPGVSSQGSWEGFISTDVSVRQDLFEKMLSLTLQIRDLFGTANHEFTSSGADFYRYNYFKRESPMIMLNMRLNFNNYKPKKERGDMENQNDAGEEF